MAEKGPSSWMEKRLISIFKETIEEIPRQGY